MNKKIVKTIRGIEDIILRNKSKKDVLIPIRNEIMFNNIRLIHQNLCKDKRLRLWFCFTFEDRFLAKNMKKVKDNCTSTRIISYTIAEYLKWDLIICPEHTLYFRRDCPKIYTGHSLKSGKLNEAGKSMKYGPPSRDKDGTIKYEKIFSANQHEKDAVKVNFPEHLDKVRVVGNMLVDELLAAQQNRDQILKEMRLDTSRQTLLVASTWRRESFAQSQGLKFLEKIGVVLDKYNVIISFHQNNFVDQYSPGINWRETLKKYVNENLYILNDNESTLDVMSAADLLLTDHTSTSLYYLFLQRPIIYFVHPEVRYDRGALILDLQEIAHKIDNVDNILVDIELGIEKMNDAAYKQLSEKVCSHAGNAWKRMEKEIYDTLKLQEYSQTEIKKYNEVCV